ncbi:FAD-dependent oxidoreductase [Bradyrhizobium sp. dw_78]|uniref:FAD-dependent oxidoreductase n=1 Tax=Bradyrhizobium sp. dw_78 TaxID=2719793 RepID=UPI001BD2204A|nr:FAD-dependent oxidoreductase [Bradyrhizobium sp. dw_78]
MSEPEIAIVGSGPSGFFAAEALLKSDAGVRVDMFDRLPTPYGLVRSGVAPDHQQIKQVVKVFDALATNPKFAFFGNIDIGRDIPLAGLRNRYDAVILAYGASAGTPLPIPGSDLPQSITATDFVGWYNGHPDFAGLEPRFDHECAVVVGHGNVGIDVARILLSDHARLAKTDIADHALEALRESRVRRVHLVGRRGPAQASFTTAELRELLGLPGVRVVIDQDAMQLNEEEQAYLDLPVNAAIKRNVSVMADAIAREAHGEDAKELHLDFLASPMEIEGTDRVRSVRFARNRLEGPADNRKAVPGAEHFAISAGLAISSIGFRGKPLGNAPFDERRGIIPNVAGRVTGEANGSMPLYVAGWIKRGATGVIGTNRADAMETVRTLLSDFREGRWPVKPGRPRTPALLSGSRIDFMDWKRIDAAECLSGREAGRPRRKIVSVAAMLDVARRGEGAVLPSQPVG